MKRIILISLYLFINIGLMAYIKEEKSPFIWPKNINCFSFNDDNKYGAIADEKDNIYILDIANKIITHTIYSVNSGIIKKIVFINRDKICVVRENNYKTEIYTYDVLLKEEKLIAEYDSVISMDISEKSNIIALGQNDGTIKIYDYKEEKVLFEQNISNKVINKVSFSKDEKRLLLLAGENEIIDFDIINKKIVRNIPINFSIRKMILTSKNEIVIINDKSILRIDSGNKVKKILSFEKNNIYIDSDKFIIDDKNIIFNVWQTVYIINHNDGKIVKSDYDGIDTLFSNSKSDTFAFVSNPNYYLSKLELLSKEELCNKYGSIITSNNKEFKKYEYSDFSKTLVIKNDKYLYSMILDERIKDFLVYDNKNTVNFLQYGKYFSPQKTDIKHYFTAEILEEGINIYQRNRYKPFLNIKRNFSDK